MFAWDSDPNVDRHLYPQSNARAKELVDLGRGVYIQLGDGRTAVQLLPPQEEQSDKSIGRSNLIPFGRVYNRLMDPPSLHYEIPHAGDIGLWRHLRKRIKVSARKIDLTAAAYLTPTRTLSSPTGSASSLNSASFA